MSKLLPFLGLPVLLAAVGYQFFTGPGTFTHDVYGLGRELQRINNRYCLQIPELESCEDMWLHQPTGLLYMTCGKTETRRHWIPALGSLDPSKRADEYLAILDTRGKGPIASRITKVRTDGFQGTFNLHGFDIWETPATSPDAPSTFNIFLINHRPPVDPVTREPLDPKLVGANSTVELFHNDHFVKTGWKRELNIVLNSDISYCDPKGCHALDGLRYPNGVVRSRTKPNQFFVASSADPYVRLYELQADKTVVLLDKIHTGYPADNLSTDEEGNVYVAGFPKVAPLGPYFKDPLNNLAPAVVLKISLNKDQDRFYGKKYKVEKVFEDNGEVFSGATVAVKDSQTNRLYMGGVVAPYIGVCRLPV